jgi:hypothetical protein
LRLEPVAVARILFCMAGADEKRRLRGSANSSIFSIGPFAVAR